MDIDPNCHFHNLLATFDNLSKQDTHALYKDLMHGRLLHSDLEAIRNRISSTLKFNIANLGAKFLYYFFQSFKDIVWADHNDKVVVWESLHNITKHHKTRIRRSNSTSNRNLTTTQDTISIKNSDTEKIRK